MKSCLIVYLCFCFCELTSGSQWESKVLPIVIVHGGAGDSLRKDRMQGKLDGIKQAVRAGYQKLLDGGSAVDAVEAAVVSMENNEYFNAGYGSVLNIRGEIEMEAAIMRGEDLNVGAVTLIKDFLNPISIAHKVLTNSSHCILGGEGAKIFAKEKGFNVIPPQSLITQYSLDAWKEYLESNGKSKTSKYESGVDTVGAVAIDAQGHIASATSTGGLTGKAVGRIGDVTQIGSGTYADDGIGGVSLTGHGESILRYNVAHRIISLIENGANAESATNDVIKAMTDRLNNTAGAITISKDGEIGIAFSSDQMSWAYIKEDMLYYGIKPGDEFKEQYN